MAESNSAVADPAVDTSGTAGIGVSAAKAELATAAQSARNLSSSSHSAQSLSDSELSDGGELAVVNEKANNEKLLKQLRSEKVQCKRRLTSVRRCLIVGIRDNVEFAKLASLFDELHEDEAELHGKLQTDTRVIGGYW